MTTFFFLCLPIPERGQINEWTILFWSVEGSFFSYFYSLFANKVKNQVRRIGKVDLYLQISRSVNNLKVEAYEPESALDHYELP